MDGLEIVRGLMARGYPPHQAAALAGHFLQESGGNPSALNKDEGAFGLGQWRLDRRTNLEGFAKAQGKSASDPDVQLDFVGRELGGPERKAGAGFLAAPDVAGASAALKPYIRFGDESDEVRLQNAKGLFGKVAVGSLAAPATAAGPVANPSGAVGALVTGTPSPTVTPTPDGTSTEAIGKLGRSLAGREPQFDPVQPLQMARPNIGQSQQIAAALARAYMGA
jgi:hypothetical protein